ncbi:DUF6542 domain-containing protein [Aeromicrobium duanguangcaii]|uniref:DUF6542 domain-containing protein n=1 Tax=Aeromicrobium duanguangcaii TaxID=2968086 RepID=A0ABY5KFI0_9ACTN|nr:DUF6542 domain-containing protein [Aeromicrobium duanguangcaii]MCD9153698.1 hypothetical protein [Aeromicrobium duanguangcaii]MCL3836326.1 hypothetical protein [Aeromicrobium duanguangcaii]UUI69222.1 hypothetical protein NP095_03700 [Aeromicrobium duanguangcaii]
MSSPAAGAVIALARTPAAAARYDLTPRAAVVCSVLGLAAVTGLDLLDGRLGPAFSVAFVLVVVSAATAVQERGFFTVGILPPVLLVGALLVVALLAPDAIVITGLPEGTGVFGRTLSATIAHGVPLLIGHAVAIAVIVGRILTLRR